MIHSPSWHHAQQSTRTAAERRTSIAERRARPAADSSLTGAFTLDTGDGADTVDIERVGASVGVTTFAVLARINTGPGADSLNYLTGGNTFGVAPVITSVETIT